MGTSVAGQTIVVVGGASGIGRACALRLITGGARVACVDRNVDQIHETVHDLGAQSAAFALDIGDDSRVAPVLDEVERWAGPIQGLVNAAGITGETGLRSHEVDLDDFDDVVWTNLRGAFVLSRSILPRMLAEGYGRILHLASIAGKEGNAGMVAYSASKAGLIGMVKAQGKEYAESGITINALAPAVIRTAMVEAMPDSQVEYMTSKIPMGRCGSLDECAELAAWIVSPACSYTTGFTFDLSGGRAVY